MVNVLEGNSFGSKLGAALGGGLGQGFSQGMSQAQKFAHEIQLQETKQKKDQQAADTLEWENTLGQLKDLNSVTGLIPAFPWSSKAQQREKYDVLAFQLERYARAAHTKGALSARVYNSLLSKLPSSSATPEQNAGRIEAWEDALLRKGGKAVEEEGKEPVETEAKGEEKFLTMRDPSGALRKVSSKQVKEAQKAGYKVIK